MRIVLTPRLVRHTQLYDLDLLIKSLNYIVDNKVEVSEYDRFLPGERRA
jgi:hypothetical protein